MTKQNAGFTLLELMTVMLIMFILMGTATLSLRGVMRGAGVSGSISNVRAVLSQARQHAIMNNRPTGVVFLHDGLTNTMTVAAIYGKASAGSDATRLITQEPFVWSDQEMQNTTIYNLQTGGYGYVKNDDNVADYQMFRLDPKMNVGGWVAGQDVGFAVGAVRSLPEGMEFSGLPLPPVVIFNPDGSARADFEVSLQERNVAEATNNAVKLKVEALKGWVEVQ